MSCSFREYDYGIDVTLHEITRRESRYIESGFNLDIQAKSTINAVIKNDLIKYDLDVKNYEDLREIWVGTPRILVLLALPEPESEWASFGEDQLILRRCAYWASLKGREPTTNQTSIRISIPLDNRFNTESLQQIMGQLRQGDDL